MEYDCLSIPYNTITMVLVSIRYGELLLLSIQLILRTDSIRLQLQSSRKASTILFLCFFCGNLLSKKYSCSCVMSIVYSFNMNIVTFYSLYGNDPSGNVEPKLVREGLPWRDGENTLGL